MSDFVAVRSLLVVVECFEAMIEVKVNGRWSRQMCMSWPLPFVSL